jgi:hypothetical protein
MRDELRRFYRKLKAFGRLRIPVFQKRQLRKAVKRHVQFERVEVLAVELKPAPHGQFFGVENPAPMPVVVARAADVGSRHFENFELRILC